MLTCLERNLLSRRVPPDPKLFFPSKVRLGVLIVPCLLGVGISLQSDHAVEFVLAEMDVINILAIIIPLFIAFILVQMAFDPKPVLVFNQLGIHCQRPPIGLIPWDAVIGIGTARATLMRKVLMIALESDKLDDKAYTFVKNSVGMLPLISPNLAKFQEQAEGFPSIHIPISYLSSGVNEIESSAKEFILYYVEDIGRQK